MRLGLVGRVVHPEPEDGRRERADLHEGREGEVEDVELEEHRRPAVDLDVRRRRAPHHLGPVGARDREEKAEGKGERHRQRRHQEGDAGSLDEEPELREPELRRRRHGVARRREGRLRRIAEPLLARIVDPVRAEDCAELAARVELRDGVADRLREVGLVLARGDGVRAVLHVTDDEERGVGLAVAVRDDVVHQHGVGPALVEIEVRLLDTLVGHRLRARLAEEIVGHRARQAADAAPPERREIGTKRRVPAACHQALGEEVVRTGERDARRTRGRHLEPVHGDVEGAALERRDERGPVVLHELLAHAEARRELPGEIDLEASELSVRCLRREGLAALHVAAPAEHALGADALETARTRQPRREEQDGEREDGKRARQGHQSEEVGPLPAITSRLNAARRCPGTGIGRRVARSTNTCTKCPMAQSSSLPRGRCRSRSARCSCRASPRAGPPRCARGTPPTRR